MYGEAGWWTTSQNIGVPPPARVMGVGRQQQQNKLKIDVIKESAELNNVVGNETMLYLGVVWTERKGNERNCVNMLP